MREHLLRALTSKVMIGVVATTLAAGSAGAVIATQTIGDSHPADESGFVAADETTTTTSTTVARTTTSTTVAPTTTTTDADADRDGKDCDHDGDWDKASAGGFARADAGDRDGWDHHHRGHRGWRH